MLSMYPACFFKEESGYSVIFPDLDLATCGETMNKAMIMAIDCLAGRLRWLRQDGDQVPKPSPMDSVDPLAIAKELKLEPEKVFVNMVSVDVEAYAQKHFGRSVRKTLTVPTCSML